MPVEQVPSTLKAGHRTRDGRPAADGGLQQLLDRLIGDAGEPAEPFPPPAKEGAQASRERQDDVPVWHRFQDLLGHELAEGHLALRVAGGVQAALLARETNPYKLHPLLTR
jgi:hypothetical protein